MINLYDYITNEWDIRYSEFISELILFNQKIGLLNRDQIVGELVYNTQLAFDRQTRELLMVRIDNAKNILHINPNEYTKKDIIKKVKEYLYEQSQTTAYHQQHSACCAR